MRLTAITAVDVANVVKRKAKELTGGAAAITMLVSMMLFSSPAAAECACFCVNGDLQTMCTTVEEAQADPAMCSAYSHKQCPSEPGDRAGNNYEAPADGATNCRDIRVFDALRGVFNTVKACDVLDAD